MQDHIYHTIIYYRFSSWENPRKTRDFQIDWPVGPHSKDMCKDLFKLIKWGCKATNDFFRGVYCGRLWLTRTEAEECIYNGWAMCDPLFAFYVNTFFL